MRRAAGPISRALALVTLLVVHATSRSASASSADELVRMARTHEAAQEDDLAVRRYMEALALDPLSDEAYLGLAGLRVRQGDLREAERVYSVALEHHPQLRSASLGRAEVRRRLGARDEAIRDLLTGSEDDPAALRVLATWYGEEGQTPAQLAVWRRIVARAETTKDAALEKEARATVRALVILVGPADPAAASHPGERSLVRRLVSTLARKGG